MSSAEEHLTHFVAVSRARLENLEQRVCLDAERDKLFRLMHADGLNARQIAEAIHARLTADGLTPEQIGALGVGAWNIRRVIAGR